MDLGNFSPFSPAGSDWMRMMPQGRTGTVEDAAAEGDTSELSSDTKSATALEEKREDGDEDSAAKEKKREAEQSKLRAAFAKFDLDGDGFMTLPELRTVLTRPGGGQPMADEQIQKLFTKMDVDGDGKVDLDEFSKTLASGEAKLLQFVDPVAALNFEYSTAMLLMPFLRFKEQELARQRDFRPSCAPTACPCATPPCRRLSSNK